MITLVNDNHMDNYLKEMLVFVYYGSIVNNQPNKKNNKKKNNNKKQYTHKKTTTHAHKTIRENKRKSYSPELL